MTLSLHWSITISGTGLDSDLLQSQTDEVATKLAAAGATVQQARCEYSIQRDVHAEHEAAREEDRQLRKEAEIAAAVEEALREKASLRTTSPMTAAEIAALPRLP